MNGRFDQWLDAMHRHARQDVLLMVLGFVALTSILLITDLILNRTGGHVASNSLDLVFYSPM